jgi:hypothetical protein
VAAQQLKLLGKDFVLIPKKEFDAILSQARQQTRQDRGDVAEARRRSKEKSISLKVARKLLAL